MLKKMLIAAAVVAVALPSNALADDLDDFAVAAAQRKKLPPPSRIDDDAKRAFARKWGLQGQLFLTVDKLGHYIEHPQSNFGYKWRVNKGATRFELLMSDNPDSNEFMSIYMLGGQPYLLSHSELLTPLTTNFNPSKQWR